MSDELKPFSGETMTCCVCGAVQKSDPAVKSDWRILEVDRVRHYACPQEFPPDGASAGQFELAYKRVLKTILANGSGGSGLASGETKPQNPEPKAGHRTCRKCGCTEDRACLKDGVPCHWVLLDLCSACVPQAFNERDIRHLQRVDFGIRFTGAEAFSLLAAIQLALRHPNYPDGPSKAAVIGIAQTLQEQVSVTKNLTAIAAAGWCVTLDESAAAAAQIKS